jgi:hypothetical protein
VIVPVRQYAMLRVHVRHRGEESRCHRQIVIGLARHEIGVIGGRFVDDEVDLVQRT